MAESQNGIESLLSRMCLMLAIESLLLMEKSAWSLDNGDVFMMLVERLIYKTEQGKTDIQFRSYFLLGDQ